jgi:hypothetical protein
MQSFKKSTFKMYELCVQTVVKDGQDENKMAP